MELICLVLTVKINTMVSWGSNRYYLRDYAAFLDSLNPPKFKDPCASS